MKPLELPILVYKDGTESMEKMGIDLTINDAEERTATFYSIDVIAPHWEEGSDFEFCTVFSAGHNFAVTLSYNEVKERITLNS